MTRLLAFAFSIALCNPLSAAFGWKRTLTIDHTQVGGTDQSNFPVLVSFTNTALKTVANGGHVTNSSGFDIVFYADAGFVTKLDHEIERYVATTGETIMWVRIPSVSHTADTVFYMGYGNSSLTTSQENKAGVWDSNFKGVWHLSDGTTLSAADSTSNANNGTLTNAPTAQAGSIGGAASFVQSSSQYIDLGTDSSLDSTGNITISAWVNPTSGATDASLAILSRDGSFGTPNYLTYLSSSDLRYFPNPSVGEISSGYTASNGSWTLIAITRNSGAITFYANGSQVGTGGTAHSVSASAGFHAAIGKDVTNAGHYWNGKLDEVRISSLSRSADWILAEYNNQKASSAFLALGSEGANAINPGRIVDLSNPNSIVTLASGERVTVYLFDSTYTANQPTLCSGCPALPNFLNYSVVAGSGNAGDTIGVSLLTYDGQLVADLTGGVLFLGSKAPGSPNNVPVSFATGVPVALGTAEQSLLFATSRFRADLTNTSIHSIDATLFTVALTGLVNTPGSTYSLGVAASARLNEED